MATRNGTMPSPAEWSGIAILFGWARREEETVRLVAEGVPRKAAAARLGISLSTLQTHLRRAMDKASADDLIGLIWTVVALRDRERAIDRPRLSATPGAWTSRDSSSSPALR